MTGGFLAVVMGMLITTTAATPLELARDGRARAVIVVADDAPETDATAAADLQRLVFAIAGARLEIVRAPRVTAARRGRVFVGEVARRRLEGEVEAPGPDGTVLWSRGSDLHVYGEGRRGTLYAVTALAERLGVSFLAPDETVVRPQRRLVVPPLRERSTPTFSYREILSRDVVDRHPEFAARRRLNGHHQGIPAALGGVEEILGYTHTFAQLLPAGRHFDAHPEWYAEVAGRRQPGQLCLESEGARAALIKEAGRWLVEHPAASVISISQNDGHPPCACARCTARVAALGSHSDHLLAFVNDVAAALAPLRPGLVIETLAYRQTTPPPRTVRPADNVLVRLSTIDVDFGRPLVGPDNATFTAQLAGWRAVAPRLHVWHYVVNFGDFLEPWGTLHRIGPDLQVLADAGVTGLLAQGDVWNETGSFQALRTWLTSSALWSPHADPPIDAFLDGYYGPAAPAMQRLLQALAPAESVELRFGPGVPTSTSAFFAEAWPAIDEGRRLAPPGSRFARRVAIEALAVEMAWLRSTPAVRRAVRATPPPGVVIPDDEELVRRALAASSSSDPRSPTWGANRFVSEGVELTADLLRAAALPPTPSTVWPDEHGAGRHVDLDVGRAVLRTGARLIDDSTSPAGRSACIDGEVRSWALQLEPGPFDLDGFDEAAIVARVRCVDCAAGATFQWGTWAPTGERPLVRQHQVVTALDDDDGDWLTPAATWQTYHLPPRPLRTGSTIFIMPTSAVGRLCVDRVTLVAPDHG